MNDIIDSLGGVPGRAAVTEAWRGFPGVEGKTHMDVAARGLMPRSTRDALAAHLDEFAAGEVDKHGYFDMIERVRGRFARSINAAAEEIAFTKNITEGLNIVAASLDWKPGDNLVLCPEIEHPANFYPWLNLQRLGVELRMVAARDGLVPVDFAQLALGRRLYRSGENDYFVNRQRVRLRDLVDLLDAAHLAENAFLFIGQGMVDQALALRPEERRPLFDEVAGVRRHERRRRHAGEQLTESEAHLARGEDILAELRPQARRLATQAEQQASREVTADELASALLLSMHARWFESARRVAATALVRDRARADVDRLLADLGVAESAASAVARELAARTADERERREAHDVAQASSTAARLRGARLTSEFEALAPPTTSKRFFTCTKAAPPDMPAAKLRPVGPITSTRPPVMYSQP